MLRKLLGLSKKDKSDIRKNVSTNPPGGLPLSSQKKQVSNNEMQSEAPAEIKCPYTQQQVLAAAKWWLGALEIEVPENIACIVGSEQAPTILNDKQKNLFIVILSELIWARCNILSHLDRFSIDAQDIKLVLNKLGIKIDNFDKLIGVPFATTLCNNGALVLQNGWGNSATIFDPENVYRNFKTGKEARKIEKLNFPSNEIIKYRQTISTFCSNKKLNRLSALPAPLFSKVLTYVSPDKLTESQAKSEITRVINTCKI